MTKALQKGWSFDEKYVRIFSSNEFRTLIYISLGCPYITLCTFELLAYYPK